MDRVKQYKNLIIAGLIVAGLISIALLVGGNTFLINTAALALIWAVYGASWDILAGYTGLLNFGQLLFAGSAAYTVAFLENNFDIPFPLVILAGIAAALIAGLLMSIPTFRVRHSYFALVSLVLVLIFEKVCLTFVNVTGGEYGLNVMRAWSPESMYYVVLAVAITSIAALRLLVNSRLGLAFKAIREDEDSARAVGLDVGRLKVLSCLISALTTGIAGICHLYILEVITPNIFSMMSSFQVIIFSIVGGMGTLFGAALGAGLLSVFFEAIRPMAEWRTLLYALLLIAVIMAAPKGIWGEIGSRRGRPTSSFRFKFLR